MCVKNILSAISLLFLLFLVPDLNGQEKEGVRKESKGMGMGSGIALLEPMHITLMQLEDMDLTGDPDLDLAKIFQLHHKGALDMLDQIIEKGSDPSTTELAESMKEKREKELLEIDKFISGNTPSQPDSEFVEKLRSQFEKERERLEGNLDLTGNIDKDFATLMAIHNEQGIELAQTGLEFSKNPDMKHLLNRMQDNLKIEKQDLEKLKNN